MPKPRPASLALNIAPSVTPPAVIKPTSPQVWQRSYSMPRTPSVSRPPSYSSMRGAMPDLPEGNIVYQSLQRPKLLRGAEWQYSMINNLVAGFLVLFAITGWNWHLLLAAAILGGPVQWLLRMLSRHDPQFFAVYFRSQRHPLIRHPN